MDAEFSALFNAVWVGESPIEVLADYIREKLDDWGVGRTLVGELGLRKAVVRLIAERFYGAENIIHVILRCEKHYYKFEKCLPLEAVTTPAFTEWLTEQMNAISVDALKSWWSFP